MKKNFNDMMIKKCYPSEPNKNGSEIEWSFIQRSVKQMW